MLADLLGDVRREHAVVPGAAQVEREDDSQWDPPAASGRSKMVRVGAKTSEGKPIPAKCLPKPVFLGRRTQAIYNENRTHTPPSPARRRHRAFDDDGAAAAPSTRASPALADKMTFQMKPMAHV